MRSTEARFVETRLPDFPYGPVIETIISAEGAAAFEPLIASGKVDQLADPKQIAGLRAGLEIPAKDYLQAMRIRRLVQRGFRELFAGVDVLLAPARLGTAPAVNEPLDRRAERATPKDRGMSAIIPAGNLAGLPSLVLPCGFAGGPPGGRATGRPAVLGKHPAGARPRVPGPHGLAPAEATGGRSRAGLPYSRLIKLAT